MKSSTFQRNSSRLASAAILAMILAAPLTGAERPANALEQRLAQIDQLMPGSLGVHVIHLEQGWSASHQANRDWYLASTIKIPLAIALMQQAEAGKLSLDEELELSEADFVDGSGELLWRDPGERFSLGELNRRSIRDSDSTATDLLIRHLGETRLNELVTGFAGCGTFGPITTILQVRHDAWSEVHPGARDLSNLDFIELSTERDAARRHAMILEMLDLPACKADAQSTRESFSRYYQRGYNQGNLEAFGRLLKRLVRGQLLNEEHTDALIEIMESVNTGDRRIKAGLPDGTPFAHKTGTQIERACNVGIINPRQPANTVIVMACAEDYGELRQAELAFARIGQALAELAL